MNEIFWIERHGKRRRATRVVCTICGKSFDKTLSAIKLTEKRGGTEHFCSPECGYASQRRKIEVTCGACEAKLQRKRHLVLNSKTGTFFCDAYCKIKAQQIGSDSAVVPEHYGVSDYRTVALRAFGSECEICKGQKLERQAWENLPETLEVHHIDGDRSNNSLENLIVLCGTHHNALTWKFAVLEKREFVLITEGWQSGNAAVC